MNEAAAAYEKSVRRAHLLVLLKTPEFWVVAVCAAYLFFRVVF